MKLAGGSLPSTAGLSWLAEKGYRTVLDLRESAEVSPVFIADAASKGLRYVALPINLKSLDADRLARFQFELAAPEARPLFFFDSDGTRAGALWYIRRVTLDHVDASLARREAEDLGLKDKGVWQTATAYVQKLEAAKSHPASTRTGAADPPATSAAPSAPPQQARIASPSIRREPRRPMSHRRRAVEPPGGGSFRRRSGVPKADSRSPPAGSPGLTLTAPRIRTTGDRLPPSCSPA